MRHLLTFLMGFSIISANICFAYEGVPPEVVRVQAKSKMNNNTNSSVYVDMPDAKSTQKKYYSAPRYRSTVFPGSLRENINRIASFYGWKQVVWQAPFDYKWVGTTQIQAQNLPDLLNQIMNDYPLQAVFYQGNHILVIAPRTIR